MYRVIQDINSQGDEKWEKECPVCIAKKSIEHFVKIESIVEQT